MVPLYYSINTLFEMVFSQGTEGQEYMLELFDWEYLIHQINLFSITIGG